LPQVLSVPPLPVVAMGLEEELDEFLRKSGVDDRAAQALRSEDEKTKRAVLDRGDMADCRNPSASLMARIRVAKEGGTFGGGGGGGGGGAFGGGSYSRPRSRSRSPPRGMGMGGPGGREIDDFVRDNDIDEMAARQLRESDPAVQKNVLERGSLTDCRNPSAVLLARIRDAKASRAKPTMEQLGMSSAQLPATPMMYGPCGAYGNPQAMYAAQYANYAYAAQAYGGAAAGAYAQPQYGAYPTAAYGAYPAAGATAGYAAPGYPAPAGYPSAVPAGYPSAVPAGYPPAIGAYPAAGAPPVGYPPAGVPPAAGAP